MKSLLADLVVLGYEEKLQVQFEAFPETWDFERP